MCKRKTNVENLSDGTISNHVIIEIPPIRTDSMHVKVLKQFNEVYCVKMRYQHGKRVSSCWKCHLRFSYKNKYLYSTFLWSNLKTLSSYIEYLKLLHYITLHVILIVEAFLQYFEEMGYIIMKIWNILFVHRQYYQLYVIICCNIIHYW